MLVLLYLKYSDIIAVCTSSVIHWMWFPRSYVYCWLATQTLTHALAMRQGWLWQSGYMDDLQNRTLFPWWFLSCYSTWANDGVVITSVSCMCFVLGRKSTETPRAGFTKCHMTLETLGFALCQNTWTNRMFNNVLNKLCKLTKWSVSQAVLFHIFFLLR